MRCVFVGDVSLGDHPKSVGFGFYSMYSNGIPKSHAARLVPEVPRDVLFGNLEFGIGADTLGALAYESRNCRGVSHYAEFLEAAGFTHMNVANNHTFEYGWEEFQATVGALTRAGIRPVGLRDQEREPPVVTLDGLSIAFLGWSSRPRQGFSEDPGYAEFLWESCIPQIRAAGEAHSHVVASMHWGDEFVEAPSPRERELARAMIDAGASVVVGHHPHVLREVEEYSGGLIAYSLGNFVCDMIWNESTRRTCYLTVQFSSEGIDEWNMRLGRIGDDFFPRFSEQDRSGPPLGAEQPATADASTYRALARKAHRRHRLLTMIHMARNSGRYESGVWRAMLKRWLAGRRLERASESPLDVV